MRLGVAATICSAAILMGQPVPSRSLAALSCIRPSVSVAVDGQSGEASLRLGQAATAVGRVWCGGEPLEQTILLEVETSTKSGSRQAGYISTDPDGAFRYELARGVSRTLTFRYSTAEPASIQIDVVPRVTLSITPRHTHNGGSIYWRGRIEGGPYPPEGIPLLAEVREGAEWKPFIELRATKEGTVGLRYTFHRTLRPSTYAFRLATPYTGAHGYEYAPAQSNPVSVAVR
jgi:hypothetical protein